MKFNKFSWQGAARTLTIAATAALTLSAAGLATAQDYIVEARGLNSGDYSDTNATWDKSAAISAAAGLDSGRAGSYFHDVNAVNDNITATFTPSGLEAGVNLYNIYYTCNTASSADAPGMAYSVTTGSGPETGTFDATAANAGDKWYLIGEFSLDAANASITFDTAGVVGTDSQARFYTDALKFEYVGPSTPAATVPYFIYKHTVDMATNSPDAGRLRAFAPDSSGGLYVADSYVDGVYYCADPLTANGDATSLFKIAAGVGFASGTSWQSVTSDGSNFYISGYSSKSPNGSVLGQITGTGSGDYNAMTGFGSTAAGATAVAANTLVAPDFITGELQFYTVSGTVATASGSSIANPNATGYNSTSCIFYDVPASSTDKIFVSMYKSDETRRVDMFDTDGTPAGTTYVGTFAAGVSAAAAQSLRGGMAVSTDKELLAVASNDGADNGWDIFDLSTISLGATAAKTIRSTDAPGGTTTMEAAAAGFFTKAGVDYFAAGARGSIFVFELANSLLPPPPAGTVEVDGVGSSTGRYKNLADAVAFTNSAIDGPYIINVVVNTSPAADNAGEIDITAPVTINGDGEDEGTGDGTPYDVQVKNAITSGNFIKVATAGAVEINDLKIHPDVRGGTGVNINVLGLYNPASGTGTYTLNNVLISGSDSSGNYLPLDQIADAYTGGKIWYGYNSASGALGTHSIISVTEDGGSGDYNATLNNCQAGAGRSDALNIAHNSGTTNVNGGIFGHTGEDGIHVSGQQVSIQGTENNRVRVLRANLSSGGAGVSIVAGASVDNLEYVDSYRHVNTPSFEFAGGTVTNMAYCRAWVGGSGTQAAGIACTFAGDATVTAKACTFYADGNAANPLSVKSGHTGTISLTDCIFASTSNGQIDFSAGTGAYTLTNCAVPTDAESGESLDSTTPILGTATTTDLVTASPHFTTAVPVPLVVTYDPGAYDVADPENFDWLRPTNGAAYNGAASDSSNLVGGAGGTMAPVTVSGFTLE